GHARLRGVAHSAPDAVPGPLIKSASAWPIHTATRHSTTDSRTLPLASSQRPNRASSNVCKLKAEKVVNPPHSPTMTNARSSNETGHRCAVTVPKNPMTSDPVILIRIVPHGNCGPSRIATNPVSQYRATPPSALPIATQKYDHHPTRQPPFVSGSRSRRYNSRGSQIGVDVRLRPRAGMGPRPLPGVADRL